MAEELSMIDQLRVMHSITNKFGRIRATKATRTNIAANKQFILVEGSADIGFDSSCYSFIAILDIEFNVLHTEKYKWTVDGAIFPTTETLEWLRIGMMYNINLKLKEL